MFGIGLLPATLLSIGMLVLPESPRWLVRQNQSDKAKSILQKLRRTSDVSAEMQDIEKSLQMKNTSFREIFSPWVLQCYFSVR